MKALKTIILATLIPLLLAACGNEADKNNEAIDITMLGGSPTGVWFMVTNGISECINASYPGSITQITPGGGVTNPIRVGNHEADVGMMADLMVIAAEKGMDPYEEKIDNLSAIAKFYPSTFQIVVSKELGISTFDEIVDKKLKVRLSIEKPGSSANVIFERMLDEYGITIKDMENWGATIVRKNFADSSSMLSDGFIDGFSLSTLVPAPPVVESSLGKDLLLLEINPDAIENLSKKYGYTSDYIPGGTYDFHKKDYHTVSTQTILGASTEVPEDTAYKIAKSIVENIDNMRNVHSALKDITPEYIANGFGAELHPGALKYYKEIGVIEK